MLFARAWLEKVAVQFGKTQLSWMAFTLQYDVNMSY